MIARRAPRRQAPGMPLAADPEAAFHARVRSDRARLQRLAAAMRAPARWRSVAAELGIVETLAHQLAGAGGVFGFTALSEAAASVERLLEAWRRHPPAEVSPRRMAGLQRRVAALLLELDAASSEPEHPPSPARRSARGVRRSFPP